MLTKKDVIHILKEEQGVLRQRFGVKRMAIFGSFATDTATGESDVDIFLEFEKPIGLRFMQLADYLESKLRKKADILTPGGLQGIRIKRIAEEIRRSLVYV
ncbi:MAG TPA: nucleotidyltransferase [Candidatus Omnitrophica bacterium]|nr:MAG: nucleotidyltransferase [Omnitrophica WOR_2 bacterium GWA2_45_18]HBR14816.1 nucleotidyltransferase [Candidatus Omnitrophota bacterium]